MAKKKRNKKTALDKSGSQQKRRKASKLKTRKKTRTKKSASASTQSPHKGFRGRFLQMVNRNGWEYVERISSTGVVVIVALTEKRELILVEQFRPPVNSNVIELPAGLTGDLPGLEDEAFLTAAQRELQEETGYQSDDWKLHTEGPTSAGMSSEIVTFFGTHSCKQVEAGGGDESEQIQVHVISLRSVKSYLRKASASGKLIDPKIYTGLYFIKSDKFYS